MPSLKPSWIAVLARAALLITLALIALSAGSVALSRGEAYRCVVLYDGYTVAPMTYILDTGRGQWALDRREPQRLWSVESPDGRLTAAFVQRFGERATMALQIEDAAGAAVIAQTGIDASSTSDGYQQVAWSRDSGAFALMWRDTARRRFLSVGGADGMIRYTVPYVRGVDSHPTLDPVTIAGWTGDGRFLAVAEHAGAQTFLRFFRADGLAPQPTVLEGLPVIALDFAPVGDSLAAISLDAVGTAHLHIVSISGEGDPVSVPMQFNALTWGVVWSPTAAYVAVTRISGCQNESCADAGWHFDLYGRDGALNAAMLRGLGLTGNSSGILPAMWAGDRWVWAERAADGERLDLTLWETDTRQRQILRADLVASFADDMFRVPADAEWASIFTNQALFPMAEDSRLIVPYTLPSGAINVELIDTATDERRALLQGAARLARTHFSVGSDFWWGSPDSAWLSWEDAEARAFITIADLRGAAQITSPHSSRAVSRPQWIDSARLAFIDPRSDGYRLVLFDTHAGTQTPLIAVERNAIYWRAAISADGGTLAAAAGSSEFTGTPLKLVNLLDGGEIVVSQATAGTFVWSPDGEQIAFGEYANRRGGVGVADRDGGRVERYTFAAFASTPFIQFVGWTRC